MKITQNTFGGFNSSKKTPIIYHLVRFSQEVFTEPGSRNHKTRSDITDLQHV